MEHSDPGPRTENEFDRCLRAAQEGSTEAIGQLLAWCRDYLLAVANSELESQLRPKGGASDLVQEACLEAHRIFARFHGQSSSELLAWVRAILLNKLNDFQRHYQGTAKRRVDREVPLEQSPGAPARPEGAGGTPSSVFSEKEQAEAVRQALDRLPEHYRQVLVWRQWDDLSFEEIARRLDRSVDAARMLWWRAIERFEKELGPLP